MKFKKMAAVLSAAVIAGSAAAGTFDSTSVVAAAAAEAGHTGVSVKSNGKALSLFKDDYSVMQRYGDHYFAGMWEPQTFEISVSEEAFKENDQCTIAVSFMVEKSLGLDAVVEISWDCDATLSFLYAPSAEINEFVDEEEVTKSVSIPWGINQENNKLQILDGDIAELMTNDIDLEEYTYHLGSKNGTDFTGAGKGVYSFSVEKSEVPLTFYPYSYIGQSITFSKPGTVTLTVKDRNASTENPGDSSKPGSNSDDKKIAITNKKASVTVNGVFPEGTTLNAEIKKNDKGGYTYDITPVDANGNKVQPDGSAVVMVPLPTEFKDKTVYVYRIEDGKYIGCQTWVDGDWLFFITNHFSEFEITTETRAEANPNTGSPAAAMLGVVALAGAFAIVSRKKR